MNYSVKTIQQSLNRKGFLGANGRQLIEDGLMGVNTEFAVVAFKRSKGLAARSYIGPMTYAMLTDDTTQLKQIIPNKNAPWYDEMLAVLGKHEVKNKVELAAWLKSDRSSVGDPSQTPWCGDAVQTALLRSLPREPMPDNPYWAAAWATWGTAVKPQRGAVLSFWRDAPDSWKGHVGFYAGESAHSYYVLGGNQNDSVTISPLAKGRLRKHGSRWPTTSAFMPTGTAITMTGGIISTNEA